MNITSINNYHILKTYKAPVIAKNEETYHKSSNSKTSVSFYKHLEALKNYNLSFKGKDLNEDTNKPIYIIDAYKNFRKFENALAASKTLGLSLSKTIDCANGDEEQVGGFMAAFSEHVEENSKPDMFMIELASESIPSLGNNNTPNLDYLMPQEKTTEVEKNNINILRAIPPEDYKHLRSDQKNNPFYVVNELGEYGKYYSKAHVGRYLGVTNSTILKCILGTNKIVKGYAMAPACEVEAKDKHGKTTINLEKLRARFEKKNHFYAVDEQGNYYKFNSTIDAANTLGMNQSNITRCLLGYQKTAQGYIFVKRNQLEKELSNGTVAINTNKIKEIRKALSQSALYIIDPETKKLTRYNSTREAADSLNVSIDNISACLRGKNKTVKGKIAVSASEIEKYSKNRTAIRLDEKKVQEIIQAARTKVKSDYSKDGFYAIKKDFCKKFFSIEKAAQELDVDSSNISLCLRGKGISAGGYIFSPSGEIESTDEDGNIIVDKSKLEEKRAEFDRNAIYAIKRGFCKRYDSQISASQDLGISASYISGCVTGKRKSTSNMAFISANQLEIKNENNEIVLNEKLIREIVNDLTKHETYAIFPDGTYEKFPDRISAAKKFGFQVEYIKRATTGKRSSLYQGIVFVAARDIEIESENGSISIDKKKFSEKMELFSQI